LAFPKIQPAVRTEVSAFSLAGYSINNLNIGQWVAGFVSGEGFFLNQTSKSKTHKLGVSVGLNFSVVQNIRDTYLLKSFLQIFDCGNINIVDKSGIVSFSVRNLPDMTNIIIPFFEEVNIQGVKAENFNDFKEVSNLSNSKLHLTKEGLDKILWIQTRLIHSRGSM
jgi:hypothetical protein